MSAQWKRYTKALAVAYIRILECEDELIWDYYQSDTYTSKERYI
jgi:succinate dehydrogenase flavin-adding protein (antitoxin of CptAB toxin-antitoxin module)